MCLPEKTTAFIKWVVVQGTHNVSNTLGKHPATHAVVRSIGERWLHELWMELLISCWKKKGACENHFNKNQWYLCISYSYKYTVFNETLQHCFNVSGHLNVERINDICLNKFSNKWHNYKLEKLMYCNN